MIWGITILIAITVSTAAVSALGVQPGSLAWFAIVTVSPLVAIIATATAERLRRRLRERQRRADDAEDEWPSELDTDTHTKETTA